MENCQRTKIHENVKWQAGHRDAKVKHVIDLNRRAWGRSSYLEP